MVKNCVMCNKVMGFFIVDFLRVLGVFGLFSKFVRFGDVIEGVKR